MLVRVEGEPHNFHCCLFVDRGIDSQDTWNDIPFAFAMSDKKVLNICRILVDGSMVELTRTCVLLYIVSDENDFALYVLLANDFPLINTEQVLIGV